MTRLEELTFKLAEGDLTEGDRQELDLLLREDPDSRRAHAALLDLITALRGETLGENLVEKTMGRIHERISERIQIGVLGRIRSRKLDRKPSRRTLRRVDSSRPTRPFGPIVFAGASLAAVVLVVLLFMALHRDQEGPDRNSSTPQSPSQAVLPKEAPIKPPSPAVTETPPRTVESPRPPPVLPTPNSTAPVRDGDPPAKPPSLPTPEPARPLPAPEPAPEPAKPVVPTRTVAVVATLERGEEACILSGGNRTPAKPGQEILEGEGVDAKGSATLRFADGTHVDMRPNTLLRELSNKNGKSITVSSGILIAQVADQPPDRPLVLLTPLAEVRVLGTQFRLSVDPAADGATQVEVTEGKVRVKRSADGKSVDLTRGNLVLVGKSGGPLATQPHTGLVAHWKADPAPGPSVLDSSGNLFHATSHGEVSVVPGRQGHALRVGPGGSLAVPGMLMPDSFTVSFWVYMAKLNSEQDWFFALGNGGFVLMREGNVERRQVRTGFDGNPQEFLNVASALQAAQWTHLAATYDGGEIRFFSNGGPSGSRKATRHVLRGDLTLCHMAAGSEALFDDIRIYDRTLTLPDLARVMQGLQPSPQTRK